MNLSIIRYKINKRLTFLFGEKNYKTYEEALLNTNNPNGYENEAISNSLKIKAKHFINKITDISETYHFENPNIFALSSLINALAINKTVLNIIDFGGINGGHYLEISKIVPKVKFHWQVVETSEMVSKMKSFSDEYLTFSDDLDKVIFETKPIDIFYTSCTILYTPQPYEFLKKIINSGASYIVFNRQSLSKTDNDIIRIQNSLLSWHGSKQVLQNHFKDCVIQYPQTNMSVKKFETLIKDKYEILYTFTDNSGLLTEQPNKNLIGKSYVLKLKP